MNTPNTDTNTDVLIVGAGPVGLFMANECARRGLRWRIVEARRGLSEHSKALAIFPRTLEVFDMAGLADPFVERANRVTSVRVMTHGRSLAHLPFQPEDSPYPLHCHGAAGPHRLHHPFRACHPGHGHGAREA